MGADKVIAVDLHSHETRGTFDNTLALSDLDPVPIAVSYMIRKNERWQDSPPVIVSNDPSTFTRAVHFKNLLVSLGIKAGVGLITEDAPKKLRILKSVPEVMT